MNLNRIAPIVLLLVPGLCFAQGGNDCSLATPIYETGVYHVDSTSFNNTFFDGADACPNFSFIAFDQFYQWTVPEDGDYLLYTFGHVVSNRIAAHRGLGCSAICEKASELYLDPSFPQSAHSLVLNQLVEGDSFLIQIGTAFPQSGPGRFVIEPWIDPCVGAVDDVFEDNDDCASAVPLVPGTYTDLYVDQSEDDFYSVAIPPGMTLDVNYEFPELPRYLDYAFTLSYPSGCAGSFQLEFGNWTYTNNTASTFVLPFAVARSFGDIEIYPCAQYDMRIELLPDLCSGDPLEPNDACSSPTPLSSGLHLDLTSTPGNEDFYSIVVPAGETIFVDLLNPTSVFQGRLYSKGCPTSVAAFTHEFAWGNVTGVPVPFVFSVDDEDSCEFYDMEISFAPDVCLNADDSFEDNDDCTQAAPITDGTYTDLLVSIVDKDFYSLSVSPGSTVLVDAFFRDVIGDLDLLMTQGACGSLLAQSFTFTDNESIAWTNNSPVTVDVILEVELDPGSFAPFYECNQYDLVIRGSGGLVSTTFCDPNETNSTGLSARLIGQFGSGSGSGLRLLLDQGPVGEFGYMLAGEAFSDPGITVGDGRLCLDPGQPIGRYNWTAAAQLSLGQFDSTGAFVLTPGSSGAGPGFQVPLGLPYPGAPTITQGTTHHFQAWYRDSIAGMGRSNFSNGITVQF